MGPPSTENCPEVWGHLMSVQAVTKRNNLTLFSFAPAKKSLKARLQLNAAQNDSAFFVCLPNKTTGPDAEKPHVQCVW